MGDTEKAKMSAFKRILFFLKLVEIRLRFVAILVITALVVGYWDTIQNYYERWQREHRPALATEHEGHTAENEFEFFCPMHQFVVRDREGKCPICGMDLVQRKKGVPVQLPEGVLNRVQVSPDRIMQAGVQIEPVAYRLLMRRARSYATIEPDETRLAKIIARFPGRVEELMVNTTGQVVTKDQTLARIYSPRFLGAAQEYVQALLSQRQSEKDGQASADMKRRAKEIADYARRRLALAGFTDEQLDAIANKGAAEEYVTLHSTLGGTVLEKNVLLGQTVEEGTVLYTIADLTTLWVQIQVAESDIGAVRAGMPVEVNTVAWPGEIFYGTVDFINPVVTAETRSVKVRVVVANHEGKLKPGMYVTAVIRAPAGRYGEIGTPNEPKREKEAQPSPKTVAAKTTGTSGPTVVKLPTMNQADAQAFLSSLAPGAEYYTCPMHPEVVSDKAGDCPKCGMHLEKKAKTRAAKVQSEGTSIPAVAAVKLPTTNQSDEEAFLASVPAGADYYFCPMDPEVVSNKMDDCPKCGMHLEKKTKEKAKPGVSYPEEPSTEHWAEGYTCSMHLDHLQPQGGICTICDCGMKLTKWRVERVLSIPETAVIDTGMRQIVYVETMAGVYDAKAVTLGPRAGAFYPVLRGLKLGDRVVGRGSFLIDAEARLNPSLTSETAPSSGTAVTAAPAHEHGK